MDYFEILKRCELFKNVSADNIEEILNITGRKVKTYPKGSSVVKVDSYHKDVGIVLSGRISIDGYHDYCEGDVFGLKLAASGAVSHFEIIASEETAILVISYDKLVKCAGEGLPYFYRVVKNLNKILADEDMEYVQRLAVLSKNTLKLKLLEFFRIQKVIHGDNVLSLNMSRLEIANYLCVDRCSLSRELTKLKQEGIIEVDKQKITLKQ